ncbi:MAG: TetR/AcrR family transcriptional regulator [Actinomycetota bacterium]|nr:TetR/AcrR family transcriptional regulator [Actinomycetota bacterium]MDQ6945042.1 TetR/AcrR family transcriptional regulator [Actinomycetota bacterium]
MASQQSPTAGEELPRPLGRPRATGGVPIGSPRDEIIAAAGRLFAERGYAHVSMSDIARAAGLQQSSLYYWFRKKELILQATLAVNRVPLEFINRIGARSGSPALKLYRLVRFDTRQLCRAPCDVNELERLAEGQPDVFAGFWEDRQRLHDWVVTLVGAAVEEGQFVACDPDLVAVSVLSFDEGIQKRFRHQDQHGTGGANPFSHAPRGADELADFAATTMLRALLRRPGDLARLQKQAARCGDG